MFNNMRFVLKNPDYPLTFNNINMFLKANYVKSVSISMYVMSLFQNIISKIPQSNFTFKKKNLKMYMQKTLIVTFFLLKIVNKEKIYI